MRIEKWIDIAQEIEIDLSAEDIKFVFSQAEGVAELLYNFSQIETFLKAIPQEKMDDIKPEHRSRFSKFLFEQRQRFE